MNITPAEYEVRMARVAALVEFFKDYQNPEADQYELQKRSAELRPTDVEWAMYHSRRLAATENF